MSASAERSPTAAVAAARPGRRPLAAGLVLGAAALAALAAALAFGSVDLPPGEWLSALAGGGEATAREIVWSLRAPRAFAAFAVGALLALAGALLQVLLRNPLADPYILGVSGGAAVGALGAMLAGLSGLAVHGAAFAGACAAAAALFAFALRLTGWNIHRVLLAGVGIAAGAGAAVSLILTLAPAGQVHGMLFWLMGDLSGAEQPLAGWVALAAALACALALAPGLDALVLGPLKARSLGVAVTRTQAIAFLVATGATVAAVMLAGSVGFVGLVVPHLLRLAGFSAHRALLPLAALAGGTLVVVADTLARTAAAPLEFPVGALTALVGVPMLLLLLARSR
ncbi:MAG: iron ABC transporter permease [Burkholderiales bacterium]|nr:iron ABC transporter permease [Burkholderiales bacterium]